MKRTWNKCIVTTTIVCEVACKLCDFTGRTDSEEEAERMTYTHWREYHAKYEELVDEGLTGLDYLRS